jgi:tRNA(His) 5'-end guanylyltransferase
MTEVMAHTMLSVISEIDGGVFGYQQSDEITFVIRNDQSLTSEPWYGNRIQKISSVTASMTTLFFQQHLSKLETELNLSGNAFFDARVFAVPNIGEAANVLLWRQKDCIRNAVTGAAQAVLTKKLGKKTALQILHGKKTKEKINLMLTETGIDFDLEYPSSFRLGVCAYKVPSVIKDKEENETLRKKWTIDWEFGDMISKKDVITNILSTGHDVFRIENFVEGN